MRRFVSSVSLLPLCACTAAGPLYSDPSLAAPALSSEQGRIVVFRPGNSVQYSVRAARLHLDGSAVGDVMRAGYRTFDVGAARHTLAVDMWDAPGRCELEIDVKPGATHYLEVAPRSEQMAASMPMLVAPSTPVGSLIGATLAFSGMAVESSGKACGGAFAVVAVDPGAALSKLASLRESR